jgi:diketogulonate reductase-like aldo/keto reductase
MSRLQYELNQSGIEFLLTDLDVGLTFMDVAGVSNNEETVHRNCENARKAYDTVLRLLNNLAPDEKQHEQIEAKLALLKSRLMVVGQRF